ncbi:conserved hypothetical protein [groundwater metagenome]|uniref:Uncharacterized protein n=1 Tax=groundwater metagenome TaxID=717931 RepID=A0A098E9T0_9ZZZZ
MNLKMEKQKEFKIYGKVKKAESGEGIYGLKVEALDKDLLFDDRLGSVNTDKEGNFEIKYDKKDFQRLFDERPDIYLRIKDSTGDVIYTTEDHVKYEAAKTEAFNIDIPEKLIDKKVESERVQFKQLIAMNPNYFGNITDEVIASEYTPVLPMKNKIKYEEIRCVGIDPEDNLLEAVIEIKLPYGFKGQLCSDGSKEYAAFYIDYNDGNGFVSAGAPADVNVHDMSFVNGGHLFYAVRRPFTPKEYLKCDTPQIVKVRAILSWENLPTGPSYNPVWGNIVDVWVQIKPKQKVQILVPQKDVLKVFNKYEPLQKAIVKSVVANASINPQPEPSGHEFMIIGDKLAIKELIDRSIAAEERIKEEGKVEKERFEFNKIISKNINYFGSITEATDKNKIIEAVCKLPQETGKALLSQLAIDPGLFVPVKPFLLKTSYEELKCIGLYPEQDLLEGIIEVKKPYGFNGNLCTLGSPQYVAFYIDWGTGTGYEHVATSTVGVHDIPDVNGKHLFYAVKAKIQDIEAKLKICSKENIVKVKAILSWNVDPTPFGHTYMPAWGNVLTRSIQIRPKSGESAKCGIETVNDVHVNDISHSGGSKGLAIKINSSGDTVPWNHDRPFGGIIACQGNINVFGADYYRFKYSNDNGATWKNVTDNRTARNFWGFSISRTPDINGWFSKSDYETDIFNYSLTALVHWNSNGKNREYLLRLELADGSKNPLPGQTYDVPILLDNTWPELLTFGGTPTPLPAAGVVVKDSAGNYRKCGTFVGPEEIKIFGNFRDDYFQSFALTVFGGNIVSSGVSIGSGRYDSGLPSVGNTGIIGASNGGPGKEIATLNLCTIPQSPTKVKCAYGIGLAILDRAIVGYVSGYEFWKTNHSADAFVTFDWDPTTCPL